MAVGVGFEPTEGINPQRFSRPPLSTTQPAHRKLYSALPDKVCAALGIIHLHSFETSPYCSTD